MTMIAAWMLFAMAISALLFVSAWIAEQALVAARRPVRGVWVAAIVGSNLLPIILSKLPATTIPSTGWVPTVAADSFLASIGTPLLVFWGAAVIIGIFVCASAMWRMARTRTEWKHEHVDNTPVLVSHDVGPALVGVMHYSIVVPQWAYSLEEGARRLLLTHEREHARHYDPLLLAGAALAVVIAPWNVLNWLFFRRLHLAVEIDCDRRVLRTHPDTRNYSALLLDVAERVIPSVMPAAAFVEHGASLETRINAMSDRKKSFRAVRVATGAVMSLAVAAAACFTPRPYAIIIFNPPAAAVSGTAPAPAHPEVVVVEPKRITAPLTVGPASVSSEQVAQQALAASSKSSARPIPHEVATNESSVALPGSEAEVKQVAPSARADALDAAEIARIRAIVLRDAPRALTTFPRADSALLMLFDDDGKVVKDITIARASIAASWNAMAVLSTTFSMADVNGIDAASEFTISSGARGEELIVPLKVYSGQLLSGLPVPLTRAEIMPSREAMLETVRERHPEVAGDTLESLQVGALLYDTKGKLLRSAVVTMENGPKFADGSYNNDYDRQVFRKAFGAVMDSGTVMNNGTLSFLNGKPLRAGPAKIMYAVLTRESEFRASQALGTSKRRKWTFGGSSSRGNSRVIDMTAFDARLRSLVATRVPDAFGDWSRGDSAVVFLFDAEDQLVARKSGKIPTNFSMLPLSDYISLRVRTVPADDIDHVGWTYLVTSPKGRVLDKSLMVVWGRLTAEATRKLRNQQ